MPKVIPNTTPLISLLKVGKLHILRDLYGEIYIPYAVYNEVEAGRNKEFYSDLLKIDWIKIENIKNPKSLSYFLDLDKGEAEAIVLASEIEADLIILDENLGRFHAKHAGLKVTGTVGVLMKAKESGYIDALKPILLQLRRNGVWLSEEFIEEVLQIAKEE